MDEINHRLASYFRNLGNAVRISVLEYLQDHEEANLQELSERFDRDDSSMSRHLKTLADYDLVQSETRGREKYFWIKREELVRTFLEIRSLLRRPEDE